MRWLLLALAVLGACATPDPPAFCEHVCSDADLECLRTDPHCVICSYDTCCHWDGKQWDTFYTDCQLRLPDAQPDAPIDATPIDATPIDATGS